MKTPAVDRTPLAANAPLVGDAPPPARSVALTAFAPDGRGTALQLLHGAATPAWDLRLDDTTERRHVAAPYHATPYVETARLPAHQPLALVALSWSGRDRATAAPWKVTASTAGQLHLTHPAHGAWSLSHWSLPALTSVT